MIQGKGSVIVPDDGITDNFTLANTARLCAAFVRSTLLLKGGDTQPAISADHYYTTSPTNHYARLVHNSAAKDVAAGYVSDMTMSTRLASLTSLARYRNLTQATSYIQFIIGIWVWWNEYALKYRMDNIVEKVHLPGEPAALDADIIPLKQKKLWRMPNSGARCRWVENGAQESR